MEESLVHLNTRKVCTIVVAAARVSPTKVMERILGGVLCHGGTNAKAKLHIKEDGAEAEAEAWHMRIHRCLPHLRLQLQVQVRFHTPVITSSQRQ